MTEDEFVSWRQFYIRWPFDDDHWFYRPAALVASSFGGGDPDSRVAWLSPSFQAPSELGDLTGAFGIPMR